jgi:putative membrane protein
VRKEPAQLTTPAPSGRGAMTETPEPPGLTSTLPPPSVNGSSPQSQLSPGPKRKRKPERKPERKPMRTRISSVRTALITGFALLIVVLIFIIQNAHDVNISFLGAHLRLSLAVALMLAAIAGALLMAAAGTARITQLRQIVRRERHEPKQHS